MTWVKLPDELPFSGSMRDVTVPARWAYTAAWCLCSRNLTDGLLKRGDLALVDGNAKIAKELTAAGLWEPVPEGWNIPGYVPLNRSREQVEAEREKNRRNGASGLASRYSHSPSNLPTETDSPLPSELPSVGPLQSARSVTSDPLEPCTDVDPDTGELRETETQASNSPSKPLALPKKTVPTEEWADEMRAKYRLRDFDEVLAFHMGGTYYRGTGDKCGFLEKKLAAAAAREGWKVPVTDDSFESNSRRFLAGPLAKQVAKTGVDQ